MAISPDIRDQAYKFFIEEAPELLQVLEVGLLSLHQERSIAKVHSLMRAAHTLKGGASSVGLTAIATLAHRLENVLRAFYDETLIINTELETYLLQAYDCLRLPLIEQITTGNFDSEAALAAAEPIFNQLEANCGDAMSATDQYIPSSAELGVNFITDIFTVNIAQGLERLAKVVAAPHQYQVAGELRAQAEVFAGFAEFLNVPEFGSIAKMALQALDAHPTRALEITRLALADFERSRLAVLSGDNAQPASASPALIALANSTTTTASDSKIFTAAELISETAVIESLRNFPVEESSVELETEDFVNQENESHLVPQDQVDFSSQTDLADIQWSQPYQTNPSFHVHSAESSNTPNLTVRVDSQRLESMNNLVGELVISREGLVLQNEEILGSVRNLRQRFALFQRQINDLRELCDQTLTKPERDPSQGTQSNFTGGEAVTQENSLMEVNKTKYNAANEDHFSASEFDSLEIDRYGDLHSHIQVVLEEMVQLEEITDDIDLFAKQSEQTLVQQRHLLSHLQDDLLHARMLPLGEILNRFPRVLRDLSTTYHKPVTLKLTGTDVLVEKAILEKLYDPLLQLLRNAFDHGIESPEVRRQKSKPEQGQIEISAYHKGNQTIIQVKDDGQGLNLERIQSRALELGWLSVQQVAITPVEQLYAFIFEPGFSTAFQVNQLSGRGMGLDLVRSQLHSIKGTITVKSFSGQGTTFTLCLPLTLTMARLMICSSGLTTLALRTDSVFEIITPQPGQIRQSGTQRFLLWEERIIPLYQLAELLDYAYPIPKTSSSRIWASTSAPEPWELPVLLLKQDQQIVALQLAQLLTEQELVIKPFSTAISPPSYIYGCTILADGSLIPVIDADSLLNFIQRQNSNAVYTASLHPTKAKDVSVPPSFTFNKPSLAPMVLVVDDAVTLRRTLALSLKRAGFRVLQAQNGKEAIEQLRQNSSVKLVICDLEMPRMNGFEFLSYRRQNPSFSDIPVVVLTSRSNQKHYQLAMQLGATAYFTKPYLEQEFIMAVKNILADVALKNLT
jgi:chemotaxis family two-component system sensor histidine kinase/response regulator PixL